MAADPEWLIDLFEPFGPVRLKRMFGGYGVYADEHMVAMALNPGLCMRVDEITRVQYEAVGAAPFTYTARGKIVTVNAWWRLPDEMVDDPDDIARFARLSLEVARRLPPKKKRSAVSRKASAKTRKSTQPGPKK